MAMVGQLQEIKKKEFLALQRNHFWWLRLTAVIGFYTLHTKRLEYEKKMIQQTVSKMHLKFNLCMAMNIKLLKSIYQVVFRYL